MKLGRRSIMITLEGKSLEEISPTEASLIGGILTIELGSYVTTVRGWKRGILVESITVREL